jgi:hypothetical protein
VLAHEATVDPGPTGLGGTPQSRGDENQSFQVEGVVIESRNP